MKTFTLILFAAALMLTSCSNNAKQVAAYQKTIDSLTAVLNTDRAADVRALAKADSMWAAAALNLGPQALLSFYAPGVIQLPPSMKITADEKTTQKVIKTLYAPQGTHVIWNSTKVEVARSGELGYVTGNYTVFVNSENGKTVSTESGKYSEIWKKQPDGTWKAISDVWSAAEKGTAKENC